MENINKRLIIIVAALLVLLLLIWLNYKPVEETAQGNDRFGLCFISTPDHLADEARYQGALATGARWDRWPLYWHWVVEGGYVGSHQDGAHDYDTLIIQDITHGLAPLVILMGTPPEQAKLELDAVSANTPDEKLSPLKENTITISSATLPPRTLTEPIFADGSDEPGPGKLINPANAWADFVFNTVERYRPGGLLAKKQGWSMGKGVRYWEIWNEPDFDSFWGGSVEEYYRLLEVGYKSIKAADSEATVLLGGLAFYEKPDWLPQLLRQTQGDPARAYFDVLSLHHYWSVYSSEERIRQSRAALEAHGLAGVPMWITESGVSVWDDYPATTHKVSPDTPWRATLVEQAAYIIQHAAIAFYHGVERYYHFMLHDDCGDGPSSAYGLRQNFRPHVCNPAQGQPRPAYAAYQLATQQFHDISPLWREKRPDQDQVAFYRPGDQARVLAVWATQGLTVTAAISATGDAAQLYWIDSPITASGQITGIRRTLTLTPTAGVYTLTLPPATNQNAFQAGDTGYHIGGRPYLLVERDTRPPRATIEPLPSLSPANFWVKWRAEDAGSGIASYDVWVSQDGEPFQLWLAGVVETEAKYPGQVGHTYHFAVRARDQAGNEAPQPVSPQATTQTVDGPTISGVALGPGGERVAGAAVTISGPNTQESLVTDGAGVWPPLSLPPGEYTFQAGAPAYSAWPTPRQLNLSAPTMITLTLGPALNSIESGDFEGNQVWSVWDWAGQINLSIDAFDGQAAARLGEGKGEPIACPQSGRPGQVWMLQQSALIPAEGVSMLSFLRKISTSQTASAEAWLEATLWADGQPHPLIPPGELWQTSDWTLTALDVSAWAGQTVDIQFQVIRCSERAFSATLDRVSLGNTVAQ